MSFAIVLHYSYVTCIFLSINYYTYKQLISKTFRVVAVSVMLQCVVVF